MDHIDDLNRPGDGRRRAPAIPLKKRPEFIKDLETMRDEEGKVKRKELGSKWKKYFGNDGGRSLANWVKWGEEVIAKRPAATATVEPEVTE